MYTALLLALAIATVLISSDAAPSSKLSCQGLSLSRFGMVVPAMGVNPFESQFGRLRPGKRSRLGVWGVGLGKELESGWDLNGIRDDGNLMMPGGQSKIETNGLVTEAFPDIGETEDTDRLGFGWRPTQVNRIAEKAHFIGRVTIPTGQRETRLQKRNLGEKRGFGLGWTPSKDYVFDRRTIWNMLGKRGFGTGWMSDPRWMRN